MPSTKRVDTYVVLQLRTYYDCLEGDVSVLDVCCLQASSSMVIREPEGIASEYEHLRCIWLTDLVLLHCGVLVFHAYVRVSKPMCVVVMLIYFVGSTGGALRTAAASFGRSRDHPGGRGVRVR